MDAEGSSEVLHFRGQVPQKVTLQLELLMWPGDVSNLTWLGGGVLPFRNAHRCSLTSAHVHTMFPTSLKLKCLSMHEPFVLLADLLLQEQLLVASVLHSQVTLAQELQYSCGGFWEPALTSTVTCNPNSSVHSLIHPSCIKHIPGLVLHPGNKTRVHIPSSLAFWILNKRPSTLGP